jgi:hypothetical protein
MISSEPSPLYSPKCLEEAFSEVQLTREGCSSTVPLSDKSAYPINPQTIPSTIPRLR